MTTGGNITYDVNVKGRCHLNVVQYRDLYSPTIVMYSFGIKLHNPQGKQIGGMDKTHRPNKTYPHARSTQIHCWSYPIGEDVQFAYDTALRKSADNDVTLANYCDPPGGWGAENLPVS